MNRFAACLKVAFVALLAAAPATVFAKTDVSIEKQIRALEVAVNDAYAANDLERYFSYYAADMSAIFYTERTTLPAYRKFWTESVKAGNPVRAFKLSDVQVQVLPGNSAAIASYQADASYAHAGGAVTNEHAFETDVWVRYGGTWKIQYAHYALATPAS